MIKKKTVFVLGAGASAPYGFPLGNDLLDEVWQKLLGQHEQAAGFADSIRDAGPFTQKDTDSFGQALRGAGRYSIDEFLVGHRQYREIGKMAIARLLMPREDDEKLNFDHPGPGEGKVDRRWYRYCFDKLLASAKGPCSLDSNNLKIITFNFDRSFERALFKFVQENCVQDRNDKEAARITQQVPVYHIHGQLGAPNWLGDSNLATTDMRRSYGAGVGAESLQQCAKAIRIFDDEVESEPTLENAREALSEAETVCFLGFSYHPSYLAKLRLPTFRQATVHGTTFGMDSGPQRRVVRTFQEVSMGFGPSPKEQDILTFLKETDVLYE